MDSNSQVNPYMRRFLIKPVKYQWVGEMRNDFAIKYFDREKRQIHEPGIGNSKCQKLDLISESPQNGKASIMESYSSRK